MAIEDNLDIIIRGKQHQMYIVSARIYVEDSWICISKLDRKCSEFAIFWCNMNMEIIKLATMYDWIEATTWLRPIDTEAIYAITPKLRDDTDCLCKLPTIIITNIEERYEDNWKPVYEEKDINDFTSFFL